MIEQDLEFHNVDHLEQVMGMEGWRMERFPEHFKRELGIPGNHNAQFRAKRVHGCEIRFVTKALFFDVCLTAVAEDIDIVVYCGDMVHSRHTLKKGVRTVLHIEYPEVYRQVEVKKLPKGRFSPWVWRIQFGMNGYGYFHYVDTYSYSRRPPKREEKPELLWGAYGSSITCGSVTALYSNSYIEQTAMHLGYDVMNKGLSGSCMCEEAVACYLAELPVDVLSLELGVNMLIPFEAEEFAQRVRNLLGKVKEKSPAKSIYVIDIFPNRSPLLLNHKDNQYRHYECFKEIVKNLVEEIEDSRIVHIDGAQVAEDFTCLSTDLLHPSDQGHIRMGRRLAEIIQEKEKRGRAE